MRARHLTPARLTGSEVEFFDTLVRATDLSSDVLANLAYFGTTRALTFVDGSSSASNETELIERWERSMEQSSKRTAGMDQFLGLGFLPPGRPQRLFPGVWTFMERNMELACCIGEVGVWQDKDSEWDDLRRFAELAIAFEKPMMLSPPSDWPLNFTYKMMSFLHTLGVEPSRCAFTVVSQTAVESICVEGFNACLILGSDATSPKDAVKLVESAVSGGYDHRLIAGSGLRVGSGDLLGIPKTVEALVEAQIDPEVIRGVAKSNAERFLGFVQK